MRDWWIVQEVSPCDRLPAVDMTNLPTDQDEIGSDVPVFQEDGLHRPFQVDPGSELEISVVVVDCSDEITDPMELEVLRNNKRESVATEDTAEDTEEENEDEPIIDPYDENEF